MLNIYVVILAFIGACAVADWVMGCIIRLYRKGLRD